MACATSHAHTEHFFRYSHGIYGNVKVKNELYECTEIFESISKGEELTSPKTSLDFAVGSDPAVLGSQAGLPSGEF